MKKFMVFMVMLLLLFASQGWSDTISDVTIINEQPLMVSIKGTYSDGCGRNTLVQTMTMENQVKISIFTQQLYPPGLPCPDMGSPEFDFTVEITPPGENYEIIASLYLCPSGFDSEGILLASKILQIGSVDEQANPDPQEIPPDSDEPAMAFLDIKPDVINLKRNCENIKAKINFPKPYKPEDVVDGSVVIGLMIDGRESQTTVQAVTSETIGQRLVVKFEQNEIIKLIQDEGIVEFPTQTTFFVRGDLLDNSYFLGSDTIRLIKPGDTKHLMGKIEH